MSLYASFAQQQAVRAWIDEQHKNGLTSIVPIAQLISELPVSVQSESATLSTSVAPVVSPFDAAFTSYLIAQPGAQSMLSHLIRSDSSASDQASVSAASAAATLAFFQLYHSSVSSPLADVIAKLNADPAITAAGGPQHPSYLLFLILLVKRALERRGGSSWGGDGSDGGLGPGLSSEDADAISAAVAQVDDRVIRAMEHIERQRLVRLEARRRSRSRAQQLQLTQASEAEIVDEEEHAHRLVRPLPPPQPEPVTEEKKEEVVSQSSSSSADAPAASPTPPAPAPAAASPSPAPAAVPSVTFADVQNKADESSEKEDEEEKLDPSRQVRLLHLSEWSRLKATLLSRVGSVVVFPDPPLPADADNTSTSSTTTASTVTTATTPAPAASSASAAPTNAAAVPALALASSSSTSSLASPSSSAPSVDNVTALTTPGQCLLPFAPPPVSLCQYDAEAAPALCEDEIAVARTRAFATDLMLVLMAPTLSEQSVEMQSTLTAARVQTASGVDVEEQLAKTIESEIVNALSAVDGGSTSSSPSSAYTQTLTESGATIIERARALHPAYPSLGTEWDRVHLVDEDDWEQALRRADEYYDAVSRYSQTAAAHASEVLKKLESEAASRLAAEQAAAAAVAEAAAKGYFDFHFCQ